MTIPTNQDFATEVRADRLAILWKGTLVGSAILIWAVFTFILLQRSRVNGWFVALLIVCLACLVTRELLRRDHYEQAVWAYTLGGVLAGMIMIAAGDALTGQIVPFVFPIIVFVVGLLLPPGRTFLVVFITVLIIVFAPALSSTGWSVPGAHQIFAIVLTVVGALLAAQVSGELYKVTEWALMNYQRERRTTEALFDNRQLLQRELLRSQALGEQLQETNTQLETARAAAEEAKRFRGQFLANMSHELRTPLNAIIGFSETMLRFPAMYDGVELPKMYASDLAQIHTSGRQLLNLINDILDLSKVDAGKLEVFMERIELRSIIDSVLATASGLLGDKPVRLETDLPSPLPVVNADESRLRQVLINLYSNAAKFTDNGSITLIIREVNEGIRFSVKDTGCGIDAKYHEIIFEEFKQANPAGRDPRSGAGLGLAIARHLLDLMNGRIWVESETGKGATFHFVVQRYPEAAKPETVPVKPEVGLTPLEVEKEKVV